MFSGLDALDVASWCQLELLASLAVDGDSGWVYAAFQDAPPRNAYV